MFQLLQKYDKNVDSFEIGRYNQSVHGFQTRELIVFPARRGRVNNPTIRAEACV